MTVRPNDTIVSTHVHARRVGYDIEICEPEDDGGPVVLIRYTGWHGGIERDSGRWIDAERRLDGLRYDHETQHAIEDAITWALHDAAIAAAEGEI